jgi:glycosyltransferase involved in cell wall biosynthesis
MTKVSIIIPAYNQAQYLAQAIESALGQTHPDVEVVVIDDGSPDRTSEVCAPYRGRPNFKYVRQANAGLPGARNRGILESTGAYLCFLDADDAYQPEKVARQAALLDADPAVGWNYCDITLIDEHGRPAAEPFLVADAQRELSGDLFGSLLLSGYFPPHTVMVRRTVLDQVGPFEGSLGGHADYELWLRIAGAGFRAVFVPESLALYRVHSDSMSKDGQHMNATRLSALEMITRRYPERVAAGINQLQRGIHELYMVNRGLRGRQSQVPPASKPVDPREAELAILWRSKLEAGRALAALNQGPAGAKLMLEGIKAVETCGHPQILLEAITEIGAGLGPLDPGRARYLLGLALKLAESTQNIPGRDRAQRLLAALAEPMRAKAHSPAAPALAASR